jgi:hypothetical protein
MKLVSARLVAQDVQALARFYEKILRIAAIGSEDYLNCEDLVRP